MGMSCRNIRWSIACALLVAVFANAQTSPTSPASRNEKAEKSVPSRLESIEGQLEAIQKIVSTLSKPSMKTPCTVDLAAYGFDDAPKCGYVRTSGGSADEILNPEKVDENRGLTLFELDSTTCRTINRQRFDTHGSADDRLQCLETLESATAGTIIIGVTADSAEMVGDFKNATGSYFTRYNMSMSGLQRREKFVFILQKGQPKKTVFQKKSRYGECLQMRVVLGGSTVSDVTFRQV